MKSITVEFFKTSEKLPDQKSHLMLQLKDSIQGGWFHGKVFETDSEYIYEVNEVECWAYMPKSFEKEEARAMMKAEKTNHLLKELGFLINGWDSELKNGSIALAHMRAATKEIEELERKVSEYNKIQTGVEPKNAHMALIYVTCGNCGDVLVRKRDIYCAKCGYKIKWIVSED